MFSILLLAIFATFAVAASSDASKPNIVVIMTDDQDVHMNSLDYMAGVQSHLVQKGTMYTSHYCTIALCCPSRVNLWTGKMAHNTNITDLSPPYGGYPLFGAYGYNREWLPVWLQKAGYKTYFTGKLMNSHTVDNYNDPPVYGLDGHDFLLQPGTYRYLSPVYQKNDEQPKTYHDEYTTDLLITKSLSLLDEGLQSNKPVFIAICPVAPHSGSSAPEGDPAEAGPFPPLSAPAYENLFEDAKIPRTPNFNPDKPSGASWIRDQPKQDQKNVEYNDFFYRQRLRALQSVDELLNKTIAKLEAHGVLDNTYIVYTTDNGFHIGQHRLQAGKRTPYEEDINIPLIIRGPGIGQGETADFVTSHADLSPTMLQWAGAEQYAPNDLDGLAIPATSADATAQNWEHVQVEHWGKASAEGPYGDSPYVVRHNNTYKAVRVVAADYSYYYAVWCDNENEMYDMTADPYQMNNLITTAMGASDTRLANRLDALLLVLKSCASTTCTDPWSALHPGGGVTNLQQALQAKYDTFYANQNKVAFEACKNGYIKEFEQPEAFNVFRGGKKRRLTRREIREEYQHWLLHSD